MGSFSPWHWLMVLLLLAFMALLLKALIGALRRSDYRPPATLSRPPAERLRELDGLRVRGLISEPEYRRQRAQIVASI